MIRKLLAFATGVFLCGCQATPTMPPEVVRAHFEAEAVARKMEPRPTQAVVYLFNQEALEGWPIRLSVDGVLALKFDRPDFRRPSFYMMCIDPGTYRFDYEFAAIFNGKISEFMKLEAGKVYARDLNPRSVVEIPVDTAKTSIRSRIMAPDPKYTVAPFAPAPSPYSVYQNSPFRCKS